MNFLIALTLLVVVDVAFAHPSARIVGGVEDTIDKVPYLCSLRYHNGHQCGCAILDQDTIMTAAHCVTSLAVKKLGVTIGATKHWEGELFNIASVNIHPNYHINTHDYDIAILKTERAIDYDQNKQPIQITMPGDDIPAGTTCFLSGWGTINENSQIIQEKIHTVDVELITLEMCRSHYGYNNITANMQCAQTLGHDACQGDSGGALVCNGRAVGCASWGHGCARPQYPGVYTKLSNVYEWIDGQME